MHPYDLRRQVAISRIPPECVDVQHLHVNATLIQLLNAIRPQLSSAESETLQRRTLHHVRNLGDAAVRVNIDHLDALPGHGDFPPCDCTLNNPAACEKRSSG